MYRLFRLALVLTMISLSVAGLSQVQRQTARPSELVRPTEIMEEITLSDGVLMRQLGTAVPRQAMMNALMGDPMTREALMKAASKLGITEAQVRTAGTLPFPVKEADSTPSDPVEIAYQAINWREGITFSIDQIPTYGPQNYKLGALRLRRCDINSSRPAMPIIVHENQPLVTAASLYVELPIESAIYTVTIRMRPTSGTCYPGWLTPRPGLTTPAITCFFSERRSASQQMHTPSPIALTALPDGLGYVGIMTPNPAAPLNVNVTGMRKSTVLVYLNLYPGLTRPDELMEYILFSSFTITRL